MKLGDDASETPNLTFADEIDKELLDFRIDFVRNSCVSRGWIIDRDGCKSELSKAQGNLRLTLLGIEEKQLQRERRNWLSRIRITLGFRKAVIQN